MNISRREFVMGAAVAGAAGIGFPGAAAPADAAEPTSGRRRRTIYFNDARHYYLFVFEPPMALENAWVPIDEVAGTSVDTFVYGVARSDGLFYPSKVGMRFGADIRPFQQSAYWRLWENMQSLMDRGLDPLTVLIDRAHSKGIDFFASLRMSAYGGMDPKKNTANGGLGLAHKEVRDHQFSVLKELAYDYETEGIELDFAAAPNGMPVCLRSEDVEEYTPVLTEFVRRIAKMCRERPGGAAQIGARVYPTREMNVHYGYDVDTWLKDGLVDFVVPMLYGETLLNIDPPIEDLIATAHANDVSVYPMLEPYTKNTSTGARVREYNTPEHLRAAAANYWALGGDGLYTWFLRWPLGDAERRALTELGDPDLVKEANKRYFVRRRSERGAEMGYDAPLPIDIPEADPSKRYSIPFSIADDLVGAKERVRQVHLRINLRNLVSADRVTVLLNGESLVGETCLRESGWFINPYSGQWLEFHLERVRPRRGKNTLEISLDGRPAGFASGITIEEVEVFVEYGPFPSRLA